MIIIVNAVKCKGSRETGNEGRNNVTDAVFGNIKR